MKVKSKIVFVLNEHALEVTAIPIGRELHAIFRRIGLDAGEKPLFFGRYFGSKLYRGAGEEQVKTKGFGGLERRKELEQLALENPGTLFVTFHASPNRRFTVDYLKKKRAEFLKSKIITVAKTNKMGLSSALDQDLPFAILEDTPGNACTFEILCPQHTDSSNNTCIPGKCFDAMASSVVCSKGSGVPANCNKSC
ncbi:hypothetical protein KKE06_03990 [Candidatus Micrarchaeota archaeon]|nr:hypothetical protein [Candidatus Micrarchaeota archaeon]MBU1930003.1 hypothetical protein [Candidatus Micrarchaeota archaeon]